jgi:uncharacterized alpha-E superfamily protein
MNEADPLISTGALAILATCRRHGLLPSSYPDQTGGWLAHDLQQALISGLFDTASAQSLTYNVMHTVRVAGTVRDRLSTDNWRVLNQLEQALSSRPPHSVGLSEALDAIDRAILSLVAVGGLEMAHMTRDDGWRFMSLGRHLERLLYITGTVADVKASDLFEDPALLDWLLDLSDSGITYRARYMGRAEWLAVADLLLFDSRNPRSAAFQLGKLAKHVPLLPAADLSELVADLERLASPRPADSQSGTLFPDDDDIATFLESSAALARRLSDTLSLRYFSHVDGATRSTVL